MAKARRKTSSHARESKRYKLQLRALGLRVRQLRQDRKLTLEAAAEAMHLDTAHLAKIEAGAINITFATLFLMADGLKLELRELFNAN